MTFPEDDIVLDHLDHEMFGSQFHGEKVIKHRRNDGQVVANLVTDEMLQQELDDVYFGELAF